MFPNILQNYSILLGKYMRFDFVPFFQSRREYSMKSRCQDEPDVDYLDVVERLANIDFDIFQKAKSWFL